MGASWCCPSARLDSRHTANTFIVIKKPALLELLQPNLHDRFHVFKENLFPSLSKLLVKSKKLDDLIISYPACYQLLVVQALPHSHVVNCQQLLRLEAFSEELTEVKALAEEQRHGTKAMSAQALSMSRITKDPRGTMRCSGQGGGKLPSTEPRLKSDNRITEEWINFGFRGFVWNLFRLSYSFSVGKHLNRELVSFVELFVN